MRRSSEFKDDCMFCGILKGAVESFRVFEDRWALAFLDVRPVFPGHCLLVPRKHIAALDALPDALIKPLFADARLLSEAVQEAMQAEGSLVMINNRVSQSVPHLHAHIVPRRKGDGLRGFLWPRQRYAGREEAEQTAGKIRSAIARLRSAGRAAQRP